MLSALLFSLMLFLAFERAMVAADEEDYDPCKAGKFLIHISSAIRCPYSSFVCRTTNLSSHKENAYSYALVSTPISLVVRL